MNKLQGGIQRELTKMQVVIYLFIGYREFTLLIANFPPPLRIIYLKDKHTIFSRNTEEKDIIQLT